MCFLKEQHIQLPSVNISMKQKQTHRHGEQISVCRGWVGGKDWEFGINRCKH